MVLDDLKSDAYVTLDPTKSSKFDATVDTPAFRNELKRSSNQDMPCKVSKQRPQSVKRTLDFDSELP